MRFAELCREAWRNAATGTARVGILALLFTAVAVGVSLADAFAVAHISDTATEFRTSGGSILVVSARGRIDATRCEALNQTAGIHAGALRQRQTVTRTPNVLPGSPIPVVEVTPSFPTLLGITIPTHTGGALLSASTLRAVGVSDAQIPTLTTDHPYTLATTTGPVRVVGSYLYPADGRRPGLDYVVLLPTTPTSEAYDECWIEHWPITDTARTLALYPLNPPTNEEQTKQQTEIQQLNPTHGTSYDPVAELATRQTRWLHLTLVALALGLAITNTCLRRIHHATALHLGLRKPDLLAITLTETLLWTTPAALATLATYLLTLTLTAPTLTTTETPTAIGLALTTLTTPLLTTLTTTLTTHQHHFHTHYKNRQ